MAFKAYIGVNFDQYEARTSEPSSWLRLDTQDPKQIESSSQLCSFPLQNGDTMSDHMFRNPTSETISGYFSVNGKNWNDDSYNVIDKYLGDDASSTDRLTKIEETFEKIKNEGLLCTIVTVDEDSIINDEKGGKTGSIRYKIRPNMALQSITWTEGQNNVKYSFRFQEVIMVEGQKYEQLTQDEIDKLNLPSPFDPVPATLTSFLVSTNGFHRMVIEALGKNEYLQDDWTAAIIAAVGAAGGIAIGTGIGAVPGALVAGAGIVAGAITVLAKEKKLGGAATAAAVAGIAGGILVGKIAAVAGASGPVGWIAGAAVAVVTFVGFGIHAMIERNRKAAKAQKMFKLINGQFEPKLNELTNLLDDIQVRVNQVSSDISLYQLNNPNNGKCDVTLDIAGEYYYLKFVQNNLTKEWTCAVERGDEENNVATRMPVTTDVNQLDRNTNLWFKDKTLQYEVYLCNPFFNNNEIEDARSNLNNYFIIISRGKAKQNIQKIYDAINAAIVEEGFGE